MEDRFSWSAAVFQIDQVNLLRRNRPLNCNDLIEGQRSQGVEPGGGGQTHARAQPHLQLFLQQTQEHGRSGGASGRGARQPSQPVEHLRLPVGAAAPLEPAFGISAWSDAPLGLTDTATRSPGGARIDAGIAYTQPEWSLRLGVKNLANRTLYGFSTSNTYVPVYDKRTFMLTYQRKL